jgi:hypothetical protein
MTKNRQTGTPRKGHSSPFRNQPKIVERQRQAVELRCAGATYDQIAEALGYSNRKSAWKAVDTALKKTLKEATDQLRQVERARYDQMLKAIWARALNGDLQAIEIALKISDRRARLDGLEGPRRNEISGPDGKPIEVKQEHTFDPNQFTEPFRTFVHAVLGEDMAMVREDGSVEPLDSSQAPPEADPIPPA